MAIPQLACREQLDKQTSYNRWQIKRFIYYNSVYSQKRRNTVKFRLMSLEMKKWRAFKARYTLATKLNSTRLTLLKVDFRRFGPVHTGDKVDCIGNKVDQVDDYVDRDKLSNSSLCRFVAKTSNKVDRIGNKVYHIGDSRLCCRFVAGFINSRLCCQCVPGLRLTRYLSPSRICLV